MAEKVKKKILIIEDDADIADLVKLVLSTDDAFEVEAVLDTEQAMATVKKYRPDAILLDLCMPKPDGWTIFRQIRADDAFKDVPVAILSGKGQDVDQMVGLHIMNADVYIAKPFGKQELIDKTYELFKNKK